MMQQTQSPEDQVLNLPDFSAMAPEDEGTPLPPRPPWWRRRGAIITFIIIAILILGGFLALFLIRGRQRPITYEKQQVTQGNFSLTVSATGPVQSSTYNVVFSGSGIIDQIDVSVGQTVVKGQVLAKLNKTSLQDALNAQQATVLSAQTGVNNAEANLSKSEASSNASVQSAQTSLTDAQTSLATTQTQSATSITVSQTTLTNDQTNLTNTQSQSSASVAVAQQTLTNDQTALSHTQSASAASVAAAQTALNNAQTNLVHVQTQANLQITIAKSTETAAIAACVTPPINVCIQNAINAYNLTVAQQNALVSTAQGQVSAQQQALATAQTQASQSNANAQAAVNSAQQALTSAQAAATSNNATAQAKISSDQVNLTLTEAQANSSNTTAQNAVNTAAKSLASAEASANASNTNLQGMVNSAMSTLQSALVGLQTAQHNLANATLLAPHAGIVTVINGTVGGTPGATSSAASTSSTGSASASASVGGGGGTFITIADTSTLQVLASVNESDTANLKVGEPAQFTVSAYGNRIFTGTVSAISPLGQTVSNVVTFPVTIDVNKDDLQNANLLPGMTASTTIVVVQQPNVTLVPVNAINFARTAVATVNGIPPLITTQQAVSALAQARQQRTNLLNQNPSLAQQNPIPAYVIEQPDQTTFIAVPVVLGLTDDTYYVVLQGVSPGDIIVVGATRG
jgi:HlyD family secretion protein